MPELDPFSQVHNALWTMAERSITLENLIPIRNRIKYEEESDKKPQISDADLPELALLAGGATIGVYDNSTQTSVRKNYIWAITTGDLRVNEVYNPIAWELFRAMRDWDQVLCPLTWENCNFVQKFRLLSADEGMQMMLQNRGIQGWSALWVCEVDCAFKTSLVRLPNS